MSVTRDETAEDPQRVIALLRGRLEEREAERDAALAREGAMAEVLAVINRCAGDLTPVFDTILEMAYRLCGADVGGLSLWDGTHFRAVATRGYPESVAALVRAPYLPSPRVMPLLHDGERFIHIIDQKVLDQRATTSFERGLTDLTDVRTRLLVPLRKDGATIEIRIRDNGTGIPPDIRDKLFQPFFTTKPTGEGTGLGLSITYDIVTKQHGGRIELESEPGVFTEFTVTLPRLMFAAKGERA